MSQSSTKTANLWSDILSAVNEKHYDPYKFDRVYIGKIESCSAPVHLKNYTRAPDCNSKLKYYKLGPVFKEVVFTRREAQVMVLIMEGYTNKESADMLGLSPRTTEFYIRNMRKKIGAESKPQLIEAIAKTDFMSNVDFSFIKKE